MQNSNTHDLRPSTKRAVKNGFLTRQRHSNSKAKPKQVQFKYTDVRQLPKPKKGPKNQPNKDKQGGKVKSKVQQKKHKQTMKLNTDKLRNSAVIGIEVALSEPKQPEKIKAIDSKALEQLKAKANNLEIREEPISLKGSLFDIKPVEMTQKQQPLPTSNPQSAPSKMPQPSQQAGKPVSAPAKESSQRPKFSFASPESIFSGSSLFGNMPSKPMSFPQPIFSSNGGLMIQKPASSLFGPSPGPFGVSSSGNSLFGKKSGSNTVSSLFGNMSNSVFSKEAPAKPIEQEEEEGEEGGDGPVEDEDKGDPSLSSGKYDYTASQVLFKQQANKCRVEGKQLIESITVSLERFEGNSKSFLYVRLPNKTIFVSGCLMKGLTSMRCLNNSPKNVEVSGVVEINNGKPSSLPKIKIQFKDEEDGRKFEQGWSRALGSTAGEGIQ